MASESIQQMFTRAFQLHQAGRLPDAEALYRQILAQQPNHPDALHLLGLDACQTGRHDVGVDLIRRAIAVNPDWPDACNNLGNALREMGQLDEAIEALRRAVALKPGYAEAHRNLALALVGKGRFDQAIAAYGQTIAFNPNWRDAHEELGNVLKHTGQPDAAVDAWRRAIALDPQRPDVYVKLGNTLKDKGQLDEAIDAYRRAIALDPESAETCVGLGIALATSGRLAPAIAAFRRAVAIKPEYAEALCDLGKTLQDNGESDEAISVLHRALSLAPDLPEAHHNLGLALYEKGRIDEAVAASRRALALRPGYAETHHNLALLSLLRGEFAEGWAEHEWRFKLPSYASTRMNSSRPQWDGSDMGGRTLLLYPEQGLGDTIQFIRYAPLAAERCGKVVVACAPQLRRLLQSMPGVAAWLIPGDPLPPFDAHCALLSLPLAFGTTVGNIPASVPYLQANSVEIERWRERLVPSRARLKVALVWAGHASHKNDRNRSLPLARLAPLAQARGVVFFSLQKGAPAEQATRPPPGMTLVDWTHELNDFADTAALVANLDLVISVDTAVAHLAGAMGKPAWVLLPAVPDWRWMLDREDTPWYPTMRLFRQKAPGDWDEVIERLSDELINSATRIIGRHTPSPGTPETRTTPHAD